MSLVGFRAKNHRQQVVSRGNDESVDDRAVTGADFARFNEWLGPFTIDVAASVQNARCQRYFTVEDDALAQSWGGERVWCNPPYSNIAPWVRKAWAEHESADGIAMLLPANRTEQSWWQELIEPRRDCRRSPLSVLFLPGRMRFLRPGQQRIGRNERPPFGCCVVTWGLDVSSLAWTAQQSLDFEEGA